MSIAKQNHADKMVWGGELTSVSANLCDRPTTKTRFF